MGAKTAIGVLEMIDETGGILDIDEFKKDLRRKEEDRFHTQDCLQDALILLYGRWAMLCACEKELQFPERHYDLILELIG